MVQSIDNNAIRPNYNAVKINIKKPEVNAANNQNTYINDNGIYNAVSIDIDNPSVNTEPKRIYDYPQADSPVTFDMANINSIPLPQGFNVAYTTTNVIIPKIENELDTSDDYTAEDVEIEDDKYTTVSENENIEETEEIEKPVLTEVEEVEETSVEVPEPNFTTIEEEKGISEILTEKTEPETDNIINDVKIMEAEVGDVEVKRPEIIPGEEILPEVDIPLVISNLTNPDLDIQAQQMEEIARLSLDDKENAIPYIVREVFSSLIDITKKDSTELAAPTDQQVEARKKVITNFIVMQNAKDANTKLPYNITEQDIALANELSPMEMAERNKEYALYTISILAKIYADEVERHTGTIVPMTDLPGSAAIVDALRYNPNSGVKIAAIDALKHIQRPEYNEELNALFSLAQADTNPQVSMAAGYALNN